MNSLSFNLSCKKGYNKIFDNKSATIKSGDILQLVGFNGSGKTSLLKIIAQLTKVDDGEILFNDKIVDETFLENSYYLGHKMAITPQLTVIENLRFLVSLKNDYDLLDIKNALDKIGLKWLENEPCNNLSAGQNRRVIMASLFLNNAKVWLLDEPFTALDINGVEIIEKIIMKHCKNGGICIFTTHQNAQLFEPKVLNL